MELRKILLILITFALLVFVFNYIFKDINTIVPSVTSAKVMQQILSTSLEQAGAGNTSNFTYSIWFYIDDWNYRYGEPKVLFGRMMSGTSDQPCPSVTLGAMQNDMNISLTVYPGSTPSSSSSSSSSSGNSTSTSQSAPLVHTCNVPNVPIQKWCNLLISTYGRTLDVYLDGKLVRTCVLPGVAKIDATAPVYITPNGGFSGFTSRFQFWADATDPQKAWNIYKNGYGGGSIIGKTKDVFKYGVKLSVTKGGQEYSSLSI